jgi:hypothetical protein
MYCQDHADFLKVEPCALADPEIFFGGGEVQQIQFRAEGMEIWGRQPFSQGFLSICKWVKPVFLLGCYGCIFYGTANLAQLCENFGIS